MHKTLYRKYRPLRLEDVVGQEQVTGPLANAIKTQNFSHAYLFTGPRGTGKTSVARIFAHEINGFEYQTEDSYVDIIEIDAASNNGVDNIRELSERAAIAPTVGKYKVYIIDEVHMLSKAAFNALLKTLEEPPAHVVFVMATTDAYKVPVTISSRSQTFTFRLAAPEVMQTHLRKIADAEKIAIEDEALELVVAQGGGSFRDSLSLLDQISVLSDGETITLASLTASLGVPQQQRIDELLAAYMAGDLDQINQKLQALLVDGIKPETLTEKLIATIIAQPRPETVALLGKLPSVAAPFAEAKLLVALAPAFRPPAVDAISSPRRPARPRSSVGGSAATKVATSASTAKAADSAAVNDESAAATISQAAAAPTDVAEPATQTAPPAQVAAAVQFDWSGFVANFQKNYQAIFTQLQKVDFQASGNILHLFPKRSIVRTILSKENNLRIINSVLATHNYTVQVHDVDDTPADFGLEGAVNAETVDLTVTTVEEVVVVDEPAAGEDVTAAATGGSSKIAEISAIMGGKVEEVRSDGSDPFGGED